MIFEKMKRSKTKLLFGLLFLENYFPGVLSAQNIDTLCIKVASVYQNISIGEGNTGFIDMPEEIKEITDSKTEFIYRGFWRWVWVPDSAATAPNPNYGKLGYTYQQLSDAIRVIKDSLPNIIISGSVPAQKIDSLEINDLTEDTLHTDSTWIMALDPGKWGIPVSKNTIQNYLASQLYNNNGSYYPDITNTGFQKLLLDWVKKQINCGLDAIFIDMLYSQAGILENLTGNINHPAVQESYNAATHIINEIHNYGNSIGRYIYIGTWSAQLINMPYPKPKLDFVTVSIASDEIINDSLYTSKWIAVRDSINNILGSIPIIVCLDWGFQNSPVEVFSQQLDSLQQRKFLAKADTFFYNKNMTFAYPLHGGFMGASATKLSFGTSHTYHAAAPEFATLDTIIALGTGKTLMPWYCDTSAYVSAMYTSENTGFLKIFPNPVTQTAILRFSLDKPTAVTLKIYHLTGGKTIVVFKNKLLQAEEYTIPIYMDNLQDGLYIIRLQSAESVQTAKMLIIK